MSEPSFNGVRVAPCPTCGRQWPHPWPNGTKTTPLLDFTCGVCMNARTALLQRQKQQLTQELIERDTTIENLKDQMRELMIEHRSFLAQHTTTNAEMANGS